LSACGIVAGVGLWAVYRFGKPLISISKAVEERGPEMPFFTTVTHAILQIVTVAIGSPLGSEVAPREIGAVIATRLSDRAGLTPKARRIMIVCGAGAGLAAVYNVPVRRGRLRTGIGSSGVGPETGMPIPVMPIAAKSPKAMATTTSEAKARRATLSSILLLMASRMPLMRGIPGARSMPDAIRHNAGMLPACSFTPRPSMMPLTRAATKGISNGWGRRCPSCCRTAVSTVAATNTVQNKPVAQTIWRGLLPSAQAQWQRVTWGKAALSAQVRSAAHPPSSHPEVRMLSRWLSG
jgi:hypothetical protein